MFKKNVIEGLLEFSRASHPEEGILLLRGEVNVESIMMTDLVFPPMSLTGGDFASFRSDLLPIDLSVVGVSHSHPSGELRPSLQDLSSYYGRLMVIIAYPYQTELDIGVFGRDGLKVKFYVE